MEKLPPDDKGITLTRERWLLILFSELGYGRLSPAKGLEIEGKSYPVLHMWCNTPIHLTGCRVELDRRTTGVAGSARMSPHSMVQEFLNRSRDNLWGFLSNGFTLRILRIVKRKDEQRYGEYRTKRVIIEIYDAMTEAIKTGKDYKTILDPPPADPGVAHSI